MASEEAHRSNSHLTQMGRVECPLLSNLRFVFPCGKYTLLFKLVMFNHTPVNFPLKYSICTILVAVLEVGGCDSPCSEQNPEQSYHH